MLTSCSPWTNQKASISQREASHVSGGRVLRLPPRRCFWIAWLWRWWWRLTALESSGPCNNQRDCSWQASTPRALHRLWTETLLWLPVKEACLLLLEPEGWPQVCQAHRGLERCSQGTQAVGCHLYLLSPPRHTLLILPGEEFRHSSGAPIFVTTTLGTPPDGPALAASEASTCRLYVFAYFKSRCLKVWIPNSLRLSADWGPPHWNTCRFWHTLS